MSHNSSKFCIVLLKTFFCKIHHTIHADKNVRCTIYVEDCKYTIKYDQR